MGETDEEGPDTTNDKSLAKSVREESEEKEFVNPHKYVRQHVPPAERSLKKPAYRNDTPSQAAFFSKRSDNETMARPSEGESS